MVRALLDDFEEALPQLRHQKPKEKITVLTGKLASPVQRKILDRLHKETGLQSEMIACDNLTFGECVTVTGLLCGADILSAVKKSEGKGTVLIPPNCLNQNNLFLDDMSLEELCSKSGRRVIAPASFIDYF